MSRPFLAENKAKTLASRMRQFERREWWLWGSAIVVTLVLTFGILSLTFPGLHQPSDNVSSLNLKEWVRGLAALVLLFDIYTCAHHWNAGLAFGMSTGLAACAVTRWNAQSPQRTQRLVGLWQRGIMVLEVTSRNQQEWRSSSRRIRAPSQN